MSDSPDLSTAPNVIYGEGITADGARWRNVTQLHDLKAIYELPVLPTDEDDEK